MEKVKEMYENRLVSEKNVRNDLDTVRHQLESMEAQISRDREKLLKLREDKKILLEKVCIFDCIKSKFMILFLFQLVIKNFWMKIYVRSWYSHWFLYAPSEIEGAMIHRPQRYERGWWVTRL